MITTADHLPLLERTLEVHGFSADWLRVVPDVAAAATAEGWPDDNPRRAAKVVFGEGCPIFWIRSEFDYMLHVELMIGSSILISGRQNKKVLERLEDPAAFICNLLLHEIGHILLPQSDEDDSEEAVERWAYKRLDDVLPCS